MSLKSCAKGKRKVRRGAPRSAADDVCAEAYSEIKGVESLGARACELVRIFTKDPICSLAHMRGKYLLGVDVRTCGQSLPSLVRPTRPSWA